MNVLASIYDYIEENGGAEAFDPDKEPDNFLELQQQILETVTGGDRELMETWPPENLEWQARYYIDMPLPDSGMVV
jgi:hypothetical protein